VRLPLGRLPAAALVLVWTLAVWWLLTSTRVTEGVRFVGSGYLFNLAHVVVFGVEAVLLGVLFEPGEVRGLSGRWLLAAVLAFAYAGLLEWRQASIPGRTGSWLDMLPNAVGAFGAPWLLARPLPWTSRPVGVAVAALLCAIPATLAEM